VMRYLQELDYPAIGEALGCSPESARANVYQALRRLRLILSEEGESHDD
jgi:DNA-directed RNA polymerase specialized sigma24 family protein